MSSMHLQFKTVFFQIVHDIAVVAVVPPRTALAFLTTCRLGGCCLSCCCCHLRSRTLLEPWPNLVSFAFLKKLWLFCHVLLICETHCQLGSKPWAGVTPFPFHISSWLVRWPPSCRHGDGCAAYTKVISGVLRIYVVVWHAIVTSTSAKALAAFLFLRCVQCENPNAGCEAVVKCWESKVWHIPLQNDPCQGSDNCAILHDVDDRQERLALGSVFICIYDAEFRGVSWTCLRHLHSCRPLEASAFLQTDSHRVVRIDAEVLRELVTLATCSRVVLMLLGRS